MSYRTLQRSLLAASAVVGIAGFDGAADAQTNTIINGATGSVIYGGGSSLAFPTYVATFNAYSASDPTIGWNWTSKGSGNSQCAFIVDLAPQPSGTPTGEQSFYTAAASTRHVQLAASDGFLSAAQIDVWNNGYTGAGAQAGLASTCTGTNQGITGNITFTYPAVAPKTLAGPIIQLPTFGTPVTLAYNIDGVRQGNARVTLTDDMICGIFSGAVTTFNDPRLAGSGLPSSASTIHPTYRSDGSGTTFLFSNHLKAVCTASNSTAAFAANLAAKAPLTSFSVLFTNGGGTAPSNFRSGSGSPGVVSALGFSGGAAAAGTNGIGYLSPDFTKIAAVNSGNTAPYTAQVVNAAGTATQPSVAATVQALKTAGTPTNPADPTQYIPSIPNPSAGYPIVGYTTIDLFQCYADANLAGGLVAYLSGLYNSSTNTLAQNGFSQLADDLATYVNAHILNAGGDNPPLDIEDPAVCQAAGASGSGTYAGR